MLEVDEPLTLYRGCHGSQMDDLIEAMRSNYEVGRPPHHAERRAVVTYMAVSMFEDADVLRRIARRRPDRVGTHLARVELLPGRGICRADTGSARPTRSWDESGSADRML